MPLLSRNIFKMLGMLNKYTRINNRSYQIMRLFSSKEVGYTKSLQNQDFLLLNLKNVTSTQNLLNLISLHHKIMNGNHILQAFRSIFSLQKTGDKSAPAQGILSDPNFQILCVSLKSNVRSIELNELVETLKILSYVGVNSRSTIIQVILQMIRQNINQLSLQQIIFMNFLIKQFESTPLSDALLIAFPIVFDVQLQMKADTENLSQLCDLLQFVTKHNLSQTSINFLLNAITKHKQFTTKAAISVIWSICELRQDDSFKPLLKKMLNVLIKNSSEIQMSDLEITFTKLVFRYNKKYPFYFNERFAEVVAQHVINNDLGFQQGLWIFQKFTKVAYSNNGLLDYLSTLCHKNRNLIAKTDSWNLYNLVNGFANTEYRPMHWESAKQAILENQNIFDSKRKFNWIKFTTRLAMLDIFIPEVLGKSLNIENIDQTLEDGSHASSENFLVLYQTISTLRPEYRNMLPDTSYVKKAMKNVYLWPLQEHTRPLKGALISGFGGESYVLTNVPTKLGHLLHHIVVMRKGDYPIAFNLAEQTHLELEDLKIPAESHVVAIFGCDSSYYKLDSRNFRSIYTLMFRTIEGRGYSVVMICLDAWNKLLDHEKIPFLMKEIREKNEEFAKLSTLHSII